jgi:hypothetical protein
MKYDDFLSFKNALITKINVMHNSIEANEKLKEERASNMLRVY